MRLRALILLCIAAMLPGAPVLAQETGTLITRRAAQMHAKGKNAARVTMQAFAACVVDRSYGQTSRLVDVPVGTEDYAKQLKRLYDTWGDQCLSGGELSFNNVLFRGSLFQALYARDFRSNGPVAFDPALDTGYRALYPDPVSGDARSSIALVRFAECVSRGDASKVRELLRALPGSEGETVAFGDLVPRFSACIVDGEKIEFSRTMLKGVLAEGLYRLSRATRAGRDAS